MMSGNEKPCVALIIGVSGVMGLHIARKLVELTRSGEQSWKIYGVSRRKPDFIPSEVEHIACDLLNIDDCKQALAKCHDATHLFYATWQNHGKEEANITVNGDIMTNLFSVKLPKLVHCALITGTKHYMGPFEKFAKEPVIITPWKETLPRQPVPNFYYKLEDIMFEEADKNGFSWSVARPHSTLGFSPGNVMNNGTSLAVYASICKYLNISFTFPGSPESYRVLFDASDAGLIADHVIWESTTPAAKNQTFNVVNGDVFRWKDMWKSIADYFCLTVGEYNGQQQCMKDKENEYAEVWDEMVAKYGLKPYKLDKLTTFWLLDLQWNRKIDCITDMSKSREMGFLKYKNTEKSYYALFDELKEGMYIP